MIKKPSKIENAVNIQDLSPSDREYIIKFLKSNQFQFKNKPNAPGEKYELVLKIQNLQNNPISGGACKSSTPTMSHKNINSSKNSVISNHQGELQERSSKISLAVNDCEGLGPRVSKNSLAASQYQGCSRPERSPHAQTGQSKQSRSKPVQQLQPKTPDSRYSQEQYKITLTECSDKKQSELAQRNNLPQRSKHSTPTNLRVNTSSSALKTLLEQKKKEIAQSPYNRSQKTRTTTPADTRASQKKGELKSQTPAGQKSPKEPKCQGNFPELYQILTNRSSKDYQCTSKTIAYSPTPSYTQILMESNSSKHSQRGSQSKIAPKNCNDLQLQTPASKVKRSKSPASGTPQHLKDKQNTQALSQAKAAKPSPSKQRVKKFNPSSGPVFKFDNVIGKDNQINEEIQLQEFIQDLKSSSALSRSQMSQSMSTTMVNQVLQDKHVQMLNLPHQRVDNYDIQNKSYSIATNEQRQQLINSLIESPTQGTKDLSSANDRADADNQSPGKGAKSPYDELRRKEQLQQEYFRQQMSRDYPELHGKSHIAKYLFKIQEKTDQINKKLDEQIKLKQEKSRACSKSPAKPAEANKTSSITQADAKQEASSHSIDEQKKSQLKEEGEKKSGHSQRGSQRSLSNKSMRRSGSTSSDRRILKNLPKLQTELVKQKEDVIRVQDVVQESNKKPLTNRDTYNKRLFGNDSSRTIKTYTKQYLYSPSKREVREIKIKEFELKKQMDEIDFRNYMMASYDVVRSRIREDHEKIDRIIQDLNILKFGFPSTINCINEQDEEVDSDVQRRNIAKPNISVNMTTANNKYSNLSSQDLLCYYDYVLHNAKVVFHDTIRRKIY